MSNRNQGHTSRSTLTAPVYNPNRTPGCWPNQYELDAGHYTSTDMANWAYLRDIWTNTLPQEIIDKILGNLIEPRTIVMRDASYSVQEQETSYYIDIGDNGQRTRQQRQVNYHRFVPRIVARTHKTPIVLRLNKELRNEALKRYTLAFPVPNGTTGGKRVWIDLQRDTLLLEHVKLADLISSMCFVENQFELRERPAAGHARDEWMRGRKHIPQPPIDGLGRPLDPAYETESTPLTQRHFPNTYLHLHNLAIGRCGVQEVDPGDQGPSQGLVDLLYIWIRGPRRWKREQDYLPRFQKTLFIEGCFPGTNQPLSAENPWIDLEQMVDTIIQDCVDDLNELFPPDRPKYSVEDFPFRIVYFQQWELEEMIGVGGRELTGRHAARYD